MDTKTTYRFGTESSEESFQKFLRFIEKFQDTQTASDFRNFDNHGGDHMIQDWKTGEWIDDNDLPLWERFEN